MLCPFCKSQDSKVLESRYTVDKASIRRRRECEACKKRFTTYEKIEFFSVFVIKRNGAKEKFSRKKLLKSIKLAGKKCNISIETKEEFVNDLEISFFANSQKEITSEILGQNVLEFLKNYSHIAYIRYYSIFQSLKTPSELVNELNSLLNDFSIDTSML